MPAADRPHLPSPRRWPAAALLTCAVLAAAACSSSSGSGASGPASPKASASTARPSGTASVAYAGSLANLNEKVVGPDFTKAKGYGYQGRGAGSTALSQEITSGEITPNVFESIGGKPIETLEPKFTSWYVQFAASPLVVAYNPASKYASQFAAIASGKKPMSDLFTLMATPGFKLGRTDPNVDPQGVAFIEMIMLAQKQYHLPADIVTKIIDGQPSSANSPEIFDETALEPRLQAGQLDASSAFLSQAVQLHLHYITLPSSINLGDPARAAQYKTVSFKLANGELQTGKPLTVCISTIGSTDPAAADAFVAYVLSPAGLALHKQGGYTLLTPTAFGKTSAIPASIKSELGG
jgi:molybdate/tungstate transport system substrate-binding protein